MEMPTLFFIAVMTIFLAAVLISAVRINVMTELDELEASDSGALQGEPWNLSGVAETGGDTVDGEQ